MSELSKGDVHKIVTDKLQAHKGEVAKQLEEIEKDGKSTSAALIEVKLQSTDIKGKLDAIYGNGSGRKGILDRLEDKQDASDKKVAKLEENQADEYKKQASFRHDVRNQFETMLLNKKREEEERKEQALIAKEEKKDKYAWIKWLVSGIAIVIWTFASDYIKTKFKVK